MNSTEVVPDSAESNPAKAASQTNACSIAGADDLLGATRLAFYTPIRNYPAFADCKAAAILAGDGLLISVMLLFSDRIVAVTHERNIFLTYFMLVLLISFVSFLLIGGYCAYKALILPIPHMPESLAYFPEIARLSLEDYRARVTALTHRQVIHKMLIYNHSLARLCARKFGLVRRATSCLQAQFLLWVVTTVFLSTRR